MKLVVTVEIPDNAEDVSVLDIVNELVAKLEAKHGDSVCLIDVDIKDDEWPIYQFQAQSKGQGSPPR